MSTILSKNVLEIVDNIDFKNPDDIPPFPTTAGDSIHRPGGQPDYWETVYDLSAKNPNRPESEKLLPPAELIATLPEHNRELQAILENLHRMLNDGNETDLSQ